MAKITKISVGTGTPVKIVASAWGNNIQVSEDLDASGAPSTDFRIWHVPEDTGGLIEETSKRVSIGGFYNFTKGTALSASYAPNDPVGWIQSVTGTTTFVVDETGS